MKQKLKYIIKKIIMYKSKGFVKQKFVWVD